MIILYLDYTQQKKTDIGTWNIIEFIYNWEKSNVLAVEIIMT